jgi:glycosyltransferase 2 family protein
LPATEAASPAASSVRARGAHPYRAFAIRAVIGIAIVGFLLWHYDARPALRMLARERWWCFAAAIAIYLGGQLLSAWRWQLLASILKLRGSYAEFVRYYFICMFTNLFVPGLIGGDAARALYLGRRDGKMGEAIASALADRGYGLLGLLWLAALIAIAFHRNALPSNVTAPIIAVGALGLAFYLASPMIARIIHLTPRPVHRALGIIAPYLHQPGAVLPAVLISMIYQSLLALAQYVLARGLGFNVPLVLFLLIVPVANVLTTLPITLNGLGLRETAYLFLFGMAGVGREDAIALGLLFFAAICVGGLFGGLAFISTELPICPIEK